MRILFACFVPILFCGCVMSSKPSNDVGFEHVTDLHMLEGCFLNSGDAGKNGTPWPLSAIIWPEANLDSKTIELVKVEVDGATALVVTAIGSGKPVKQSRFVEGQDFKLNNGRIKIASRAHGSPGTESGNPFIGVASETKVLGLDKSGNGRLLNSASFAGTAFIVIPAVGHVSEAVRYGRISCDGS